MQEDISKFVSDLMLTAIRNAFRKESIHFRGKLDQNGSSRAITFILIGFSHHLSKDGLLEKNRSLHYFFTFLRVSPPLSSFIGVKLHLESALFFLHNSKSESGYPFDLF